MIGRGYIIGPWVDFDTEGEVGRARRERIEKAILASARPLTHDMDVFWARFDKLIAEARRDPNTKWMAL